MHTWLMEVCLTPDEQMCGDVWLADHSPSFSPDPDPAEPSRLSVCTGPLYGPLLRSTTLPGLALTLHELAA